jgi:hypothetical protein
VVFAPRTITPEKLEEGLKSALRHSYSSLDILRRLLRFGRGLPTAISPRLPLMLSLNLAFRRRAIPWATGAAR